MALPNTAPSHHSHYPLPASLFLFLHPMRCHKDQYNWDTGIIWWFWRQKYVGKVTLVISTFCCAFLSLGHGLSLVLSVPLRQCRLQMLCSNNKDVSWQRWEHRGLWKLSHMRDTDQFMRKKSTIPSGGLETCGRPWPRVRTWPARTQQPAGSFFVSMRKPGSMASAEYWLLTDIGAGAEMPSCFFARGTSHSSTGALYVLVSKGHNKGQMALL